MYTWLPVVAFMTLVGLPTLWILYCFNDYCKSIEKIDRQYREDIEGIRRQYGDWRK